MRQLTVKFERVGRDHQFPEQVLTVETDDFGAPVWDEVAAQIETIVRPKLLSSDVQVVIYESTLGDGVIVGNVVVGLMRSGGEFEIFVHEREAVT